MPELIFWLCVVAVSYHYVGYPILLFVLCALIEANSDLGYLLHRRNRRHSPATETDEVRRVAVLISIFNEEKVIESKVRNCLEIDYPADRIEFLIGLDAPTDSTLQLLAQLSSDRIRIFHFARRRGKFAVLCDLARETSAEILVFTDANTLLDRNAIGNLLRHFADPRVGAVSGEEVRVAGPGCEAGAEGLYWRYESAVKILESRLNCSLGGNGSVLALRRSLFNRQEQSIVEDFQIPLEIRFQGHRVVYDPEARAVEEIAPTWPAQFARRVRIGAGNYQTFFAHPEYVNPCKGFLAFAFFSHRVLRWLAPFLLPIGFACSLLLSATPSFAVLAAVQGAFYLAALIGWWLKSRARPLPWWCSIPFHFCAMNLALFLGLWRFLRGRQSLTWQSTPRHTTTSALLDKAPRNS